MKNSYVNLGILGVSLVFGAIAGKGVYRPIRESLNKQPKGNNKIVSEDITVEEVEANI